MKIRFLAFILMALLGAAPAYAADDEAAVNDVTVYKHPQDFDTAKQMALQNRSERMQMLESVIACIQQSVNYEDIESCQTQETKTWNKIRLAYCDTAVAYDSSKAHNRSPQGPTECERALSAYTGKPVPPRDNAGAVEPTK